MGQRDSEPTSTGLPMKKSNNSLPKNEEIKHAKKSKIKQAKEMLF
uniref:Uncharacterized protein n=1 Tax=Nelumbo nucifera TaxID=4432 RepID=A0A822XTP8_NELNU|nr:TPA_asm: hypothetical protein HUJ06_026458 [Nelumbo nucifera]DAD28589.1 TPA_asm: hypothetical protein HUJ06_030057 [Nelumbo nucifera]